MGGFFVQAPRHSEVACKPVSKKYSPSRPHIIPSGEELADALCNWLRDFL